jgi:hypothetical protein
MKTSFTFLAITASAMAAETSAPKVEDVAKSYSKTLSRLSEETKVVANEFFDLCEPQLLLKDTFGPHLFTSVHYYRNELAKNPAGKFPVASVIVKEKLASTGKKNDTLKTTAVAGMIKRPAGSFSKSGDWEFFWYENGKLTTTGLEGCASCHSGAKRDYVFTTSPAKGK